MTGRRAKLTYNTTGGAVYFEPPVRRADTNVSWQVEERRPRFVSLHAKFRPNLPNVTETALPTEPLLISVVDDDNALCESLAELLEALGFAATTFSSAEAFLASDSLERARCLLLDVSMPGMSGPELLSRLEARGSQLPVIFITAQDESRARLLRSRARDCLLKPFTDDALENALRKALGP